MNNSKLQTEISYWENALIIKRKRIASIENDINNAVINNWSIKELKEELNYEKNRMQNNRDYIAKLYSQLN
jgi:predicted  nucleic acid-binding Zn-ribbon protein